MYRILSVNNTINHKSTFNFNEVNLPVSTELCFSTKLSNIEESVITRDALSTISFYTLCCKNKNLITFHSLNEL